MVYGFLQTKSLVLFVSLILISTHSIAKNDVLKMGIISLGPPSQVYKLWQPFARYLSKQLGLEVSIVVPKGFKKIKQAVENKEIDVFFINSHVFYRLKKKGAAVALAQMENIDNRIVSNSVLFVRTDSGIKRLKDLRGEKIAFLSQMGAGGYLAPRAAFYKAGVKTATETREEFTKNHTSSIHKVLLGSVKAGTMCGINYKLLDERINMGDLKIIAKSEDYPDSVFGARSDLSKELRKKVSAIIINMYSSAEGNHILSTMRDIKLKRFVKYDSKYEKMTERLLEMSELNKK